MQHGKMKNAKGSFRLAAAGKFQEGIRENGYEETVGKTMADNFQKLLCDPVTERASESSAGLGKRVYGPDISQ